MSITFTTWISTVRLVRGRSNVCTQPATSVQPVTSTSASSTDKSTARFSSIREFIHWLALGLFLGCALNMNAKETNPSEKEFRRQIPSIVVVDKRAYSIRMVDQLFDQDGNSLDGTTDTKMAIIDIRKNQSVTDERDTVLHEVLHACFDQNIRNYQRKKFTEEESVKRVTPKLLKTIRENKELMEYLTAK